MNKTVNIGLIGFGTIGSGVVATLSQNLSQIEDKVQRKVNLKKNSGPGHYNGQRG